ncbi:MAG TPA: hypothetical protein VGH38_06385 [Bryobacteraceae bacterium]|jgi:hypothetical protein
MRKIAVASGLLGIGIALLGAVAVGQTDSKVSGHWQGKIAIPDHELGITVDLDRTSKGTWIGSMSLASTTAADVPLDSLTVDDKAVKFAASLPVHASFDGHLSADGNKLTGTASSAAGDAPFELTRSGQAKVIQATPSTALSKEFEGAWEGSVESGGKVRRIGLKLSSSSDGIAKATLIAIDAGNLEIPVTTVTIKGDDLQLEARAVSGTYHGTLAGGEIAGEWAESATRLPLTFKRASSDGKKP